MDPGRSTDCFAARKSVVIFRVNFTLLRSSWSEVTYGHTDVRSWTEILTVDCEPAMQDFSFRFCTTRWTHPHSPKKGLESAVIDLRICGKPLDTFLKLRLVFCSSTTYVLARQSEKGLNASKIYSLVNTRPQIPTGGQLWPSVNVFRSCECFPDLSGQLPVSNLVPCQIEKYSC